MTTFPAGGDFLHPTYSLTWNIMIGAHLSNDDERLGNKPMLKVADININCNAVLLFSLNFIVIIYY